MLGRRASPTSTTQTCRRDHLSPVSDDSISPRKRCPVLPFSRLVATGRTPGRMREQDGGRDIAFGFWPRGTRLVAHHEGCWLPSVFVDAGIQFFSLPRPSLDNSVPSQNAPTCPFPLVPPSPCSRRGLSPSLSLHPCHAAPRPAEGAAITRALLAWLPRPRSPVRAEPRPEGRVCPGAGRQRALPGRTFSHVETRRGRMEPRCAREYSVPPSLASRQGEERKVPV